jgi:hypothetical protein
MPQRRAEIVADRVQKRLHFGCGGTEGRISFAELPLQLTGLPGQLLTQPGMLNGDSERGSYFQGDIAVLRLEGGWCGRGQVDLTDHLSFHH